MSLANIRANRRPKPPQLPRIAEDVVLTRPLTSFCKRRYAPTRQWIKS
jgi:hypothetical protein